MLQTPLQPKSIAGRAVSTDVESGGVATSVLDANGSLEKPGSSGVEVHCGFCKAVVVGNVVACSGYDLCFHVDETCLGVDVEVVSCLARVKSGALQYRCCRCRSGVTGASGMLSAFEQHLNVVGVLSKRVGEMMDRINETSHRFEPQSTSDRKTGIVSREAMRMELKELQEQERRQCSVILRGF